MREVLLLICSLHMINRANMTSIIQKEYSPIKISLLGNVSEMTNQRPQPPILSRGKGYSISTSESKSESRSRE